MRVYLVIWRDLPVAVFSTKEYARQYVSAEGSLYSAPQTHIEEWTIDDKVRPEWRQLNQGILAKDTPKPREECMLTGDKDRRGQVTGFERDPLVGALRDTFRQLDASKARDLLADFRANNGLHYESLFERDNYTSRHTSGHNLLDPESFITQAELDNGYTFTNSFRDFADQQTYEQAARGYLTLAQVVEQGPRKLIAA